MEKLTRLIPPKARLIRNQIERDVFASELVVGDIVLLAAGDRVPADVRLFEGTVSIFLHLFNHLINLLVGIDNFSREGSFWFVVQ